MDKKRGRPCADPSGARRFEWRKWITESEHKALQKLLDEMRGNTTPVNRITTPVNERRFTPFTKAQQLGRK